MSKDKAQQEIIKENHTLSREEIIASDNVQLQGQLEAEGSVISRHKHIENESVEGDMHNEAEERNEAIE